MSFRVNQPPGKSNLTSLTSSVKSRIMGSSDYSIYEAKAHFSDLIRKVREGRSIVITHRGKRVARIAPYSDDESLDERLDRLEAENVITPPRGSIDSLQEVARRPGALERFLADRD